MIERKEAILEKIDVRSFYANYFKIENGKKEQPCCCPAHQDTHPSCSVNLDTGLWYCQVCEAKGSIFDWYMHKHHCDYKEAECSIAQTVGLDPAKPKGKKRFIERYEYLDADGAPSYSVERWEYENGKKDFPQRASDGNGGWLPTLGNVERLPYKLPELIGAVQRGAVIYIPEGEKDVHNLMGLGLAATCNSGGAKKWLDGMSLYLKGAKAVVLEDNDLAGRTHAQMVAHSLQGIAGAIKVVSFSDLPEKGDVSDWLAVGHTKLDLIARTKAAPLWEPTVEAPTRKLPEVVCSNRQLRDMTADAVAALHVGNDPKRLFVRADGLARLRITDGAGAIDSMSIDITRCRMSQTANYVRINVKGECLSIPPPTDVAKDILALGEWPFPLLDTVVATPVIRQDGSLLTQSGYDEATRLYYHPAPILTDLAIPHNPTREDVDGAVEVIFDILQDFPWVKTYDYANTVGMMLTPICRSAIHGGAPLAIIDAPQPGAGKGLLTRIINLIATGQEPALMTAPDNREEWRKTITTQLMQGRALIVIDNVEHKLFDAALASVLTMERWTDRLLGTNHSVEIPNHACWIATGNNIKLGGDIPRRCFWIKINPQTSRPELRAGFKHSNLPEYVRLNRDKIVAALLTMVRAWFVAGQPMPSTPILGSFEEWSRIIGGVLEYSGVSGFLGNTDELRKIASEDDDEWQIFFDAIFDHWGESEFTTKDLDLIIGSDSNFENSVPGFLLDIRANPKQSFVRHLGRAFSKCSGKCFGDDDIQIQATENKQHNKTHWSVSACRESKSKHLVDVLGELG